MSIETDPIPMPYHRLDTDRDAAFLAERRTDPFTGAAFEAGNHVVRAQDGTVLLRESWEAIGKRFNGKAETLPWGDAAPSEPLVVPPAEETAGDSPSPEPATPSSSPLTWTSQEPRPAAEPERESRFADGTRKRRGLLVPLVIAGVVVAGVFLSGLFRGSEDAGPSPLVSQVSDTEETAEAVSVGTGTIEGSLSDQDFQSQAGFYQDAYELEADSSGKVIIVRLQSRNFSPDILVETDLGQRIAGRRVASNDGTNIVEVRNLKGPGTLRVTVTSRDPRAKGDYTLIIREQRPVRTLRADGRPVTVTLGEFSELVGNGYRDVWEIRTKENFEHTLTVSSAAFTPRVVILGPGGSTISPESSDESTYTFTSSSDGTYRVLVSSGSEAREGRYSIRLTAEETDETISALTIEPNTGPIQDTLRAGQDRTLPFNGTVGDRVRVEVQSDAFSPTLSLSGPGGYRLSGDAPLTGQANLQFTVPATGVYSLVVRSRDSGGAGAFRLSMETSEAPRGQDVPRMPDFDGPPQEPTPDEPEPEPDVEGEAPAEPQPEPEEETEEYQPQQIDGG